MSEISKVLLKQGFSLHETITHREFSVFISNQKWKYSRLFFIYAILIFLFITLSATFFVLSSHPIFYRILYTGIGVLLAFALVPLHEYIHLLTYKYFGARSVTITPYIRQMYVLTQADQFVVGKKELKWIASTPFLFISAIGLILLFFIKDLWQISISSMVLFHLTLCLADFRILNYFISNNSEKVMYSDIQGDVTYIYERTL